MKGKLLKHSLVRFALSGGVITLCSLTLTALVLYVGGSTAFAVSFGYFASSCLGYFLHSLFSFRHRLGGRLVSLPAFLAVLLATALISYFGSFSLGIVFGRRLFVLAVSIVLPVVVNYLAWSMVTRWYSG